MRTTISADHGGLAAGRDIKINELHWHDSPSSPSENANGLVMCPACSRSLWGGAVMCIHCGYNPTIQRARERRARSNECGMNAMAWTLLFSVWFLALNRYGFVGATLPIGAGVMATICWAPMRYWIWRCCRLV